ncbi:DUF1326 domain-containing protein [candidate division TA06 bacterium]|uniref:DUF1326 domain-containing protein n=1 Tax=candidate division TA06 bacterium TaxID=2250710 RepID=A0A523XJR2_UNCT6|nr:MAG: DUF1326 domain-containing protein [candidate division TA06 bacterium]
MSWKMKGILYEACASEGQCSMWFGRDMEAPCKSFMVFQIKESQINNVDVGGLLAITVADLFSPNFADLMVKGGEGGIYISDTATEEQRKVLEPFFVNNVPGWLLVRKPLGVRFVDINLSQEGNTYHLTMPFGELKMSLTVGGDGKNPQRIENSLFSMVLSDIKICNTHFWKYRDFQRNWEFVNRSGVMAKFDLQGE